GRVHRRRRPLRRAEPPIPAGVRRPHHRHGQGAPGTRSLRRRAAHRPGRGHRTARSQLTDLTIGAAGATTERQELTDEIWSWTATRTAEAIRSGSITSREATESVLSRIGDVNPHINAIVEVSGAEAL